MFNVIFRDMRYTAPHAGLDLHQFAGYDGRNHYNRHTIDYALANKEVDRMLNKTIFNGVLYTNYDPDEFISFAQNVWHVYDDAMENIIRSNSPEWLRSTFVLTLNSQDVASDRASILKIYKEIYLEYKFRKFLEQNRALTEEQRDEGWKQMLTLLNDNAEAVRENVGDGVLPWSIHTIGQVYFFEILNYDRIDGTNLSFPYTREGTSFVDFAWDENKVIITVVDDIKIQHSGPILGKIYTVTCWEIDCAGRFVPHIEDSYVRVETNDPEIVARFSRCLGEGINPTAELMDIFSSILSKLANEETFDHEKTMLLEILRYPQNLVSLNPGEVISCLAALIHRRILTQEILQNPAYGYLAHLFTGVLSITDFRRFCLEYIIEPYTIMVFKLMHQQLIQNKTVDPAIMCRVVEILAFPCSSRGIRNIFMGSFEMYRNLHEMYVQTVYHMASNEGSLSDYSSYGRIFTALMATECDPAVVGEELQCTDEVIAAAEYSAAERAHVTEEAAAHANAEAEGAGLPTERTVQFSASV